MKKTIISFIFNISISIIQKLLFFIKLKKVIPSNFPSFLGVTHRNHFFQKFIIRHLFPNINTQFFQVIHINIPFAFSINLIKNSSNIFNGILITRTHYHHFHKLLKIYHSALISIKIANYLIYQLFWDVVICC